MEKTDLTKFDNSWYRPGTFIRRGLWYFVNIFFFKSSLPVPNGIKKSLLKLFGAKLGKRILIKPSVNIKYPWFLKIGNDVWIGEDVWIDNLSMVYLGNNVVISQGAFLFTGNHNYKKTGFDLLLKDIVVEDGVWIGAGSMIVPGIRMGNHSVAGAGSVITENTLPYSIYSGNPAKFVRRREIS